jgi:hypothetical protein
VLIAAALALLVSQIAGLAHGWQRELPLATLGALGLVGVALTVGSAAAAMLTVAAAGTFVVIASLERAISMPAVRAVAYGLRLAAIAGFMGLVAIALTGDDPIFVAPGVLAGATLLMAAAVAIRIGAVPFHAPVARLIERARTAALPLISVWVPTAFIIVALGWTATLVELGATTPVSVVVVAVGVLTIVLASLVVLLDDDLVRLLGYGVIADGGFVLLALGGTRRESIAAGLAWLVCFALARTIMACVFLAFQGAYDARRTRELDGWLRRTPLLGIALAGSLVIGYGVPGLLPWEARLSLAQGALGETLGSALILVALLPLLAVAGLMWAGVRSVGPAVAAGRSERFVAPSRALTATDGSVAVPEADAAATGASGAEALASEAPAAEARAPEAPPPDTPPPEAPPPEAAEVTDEAPATPVAAASSPEPPAADMPPTPTAVEDVPTLGLLPGDATDAPSTTTPAPAKESALSRKGRATRAARAKRQPSSSMPIPADGERVDAPVPDTAATTTAAEPTSEPPAPTDDADAEPSAVDTPPASAPSRTTLARRRARATQASVAGRAWAAMAGVRRTARSSAIASGPLRAALRDLPAFWAHDRTLIASVATVALALVGLAFAADAVGLADAAGFGIVASPSP